MTAQLTRFPNASALRAMCDSTWARVQPGQRLATRTLSSSSPAAVRISRVVSWASNARLSARCEEVVISSQSFQSGTALGKDA